MSKNKSLTNKQKEVLDVLDVDGKHPRDIATELGFKESAYIFGALTALFKKGFVGKVNKHKKVKYFKLDNDEK